MANSDIETLKQFVAEETKRAEQATKSTYILGILAVLIVGGYLGFILHMEKTFLQPDNLAYLIRLEAEDGIPHVIRQTEDAIVEQAVNGSQFVSEEFIRLIPRLTAAGMEQIDIAYMEQIPFLSDEFSLIVEEYIDLHGPELKAFAEEHTSQEFADYFTEAMMAEFHKQLDAHLLENYDGKGIAFFKENVTDSVNAMNVTIDELLAQDPAQMDRRTRLQRRLLARLVASATASSAQN